MTVLHSGEVRPCFLLAHETKSFLVHEILREVRRNSCFAWVSIYQGIRWLTTLHGIAVDIKDNRAMQRLMCTVYTLCVPDLTR